MPDEVFLLDSPDFFAGAASLFCAGAAGFFGAGVCGAGVEASAGAGILLGGSVSVGFFAAPDALNGAKLDKGGKKHHSVLDCTHDLWYIGACGKRVYKV